MAHDGTGHDGLPEPREEDMPRLKLCEERIGYSFKDMRLLLAALTHASGAAHRLSSNERLEFLGDAILGAVACEMLYRRFPEYLEGDLTKIKSAVVSRQSCAKISEELRLEECLFLGKGMTTAPTLPSSLLSDVLESLIAAVYIDGGQQVAAEIDGSRYPAAWGRNKKEAEQRAASNALCQMAGDPIPFPE
jgi:ribonuclease-3